MSEQLSSRPEQPRTKFACARDSVLYQMSLESAGWAAESCGRSDGPYGWCAWMSNSEHELADIMDAFGDVIDQAQLDPGELVGNFLLNEDDWGFVDVKAYPTEETVRRAYGEVADLIAAWEAQG